MDSHDHYPPELMAILREARSAYLSAYDILWRQERLIRYVYWLEHREYATFNLVGSWTTSDMHAEIELWQLLKKRGYDNPAAVDEVTDTIQKRYGITLSTAIDRGSDPDLARQGLPIWNERTRCLVPQTLGNWRICGVQDSEPASPGLGQRYGYRLPNASALLSLFLYDHGLVDVQPGVTDPRFPAALSGNLRDINAYVDLRGETIEWLVEPVLEVIHSHRDSEISFVSTTWVTTDCDGTRKVEAFSLRGFRNGFLKIRITGPEAFIESDEGQAEFAAFNPDLAQFVEQFGP